MDQGRVAAFAKRLAGTALMAEAGEAVGALGVTRQLLASYPRSRCLLENERVGTGVFNMNVDDPETAVGLAAVLWDLSLLRCHYHPAVAAAAQEVAAMTLTGVVPQALGSHAPAELARLHSTTRGNFRPVIQAPRPGKKAKNSVLDRTTSRGNERRVLDLGPELVAVIAAEQGGAKGGIMKRGGGGAATAAAAGGGGAGGGDVGGVLGGGLVGLSDGGDGKLTIGGAAGLIATLRRHYLESKAFGVNGELQRTAAIGRRQARMMKAHAAAAAAAAAAARKAAHVAKKKKATAAAAAGGGARDGFGVGGVAGAGGGETPKSAGKEKGGAKVGTKDGGSKVGVKDGGVAKKAARRVAK